MTRGRDAMWVIGVLSGTSADGASACLARIDGGPSETRARVALQRRDPFPTALAARIHRLAAGGPRGDEALREVVALDTLLGERFARTVAAIAREAPHAVRAVGLHGQTIVHLPRRRTGRASEAGTLQIGSAAIVAERTGLDVVSDFRRRDMAVGGEGAPLVPILDRALYAKRGVRRVLVNVGGIANVTLLPGTSEARSGAAGVIAFDTGPGNMLLDRAARDGTRGRLRYDRGGRLALAGRVAPALLAQLCRHPFLAAPPPKSADRGDFEGAWWSAVAARAARARLSLPDFLATLVAFTAEAVALGVARASRADRGAPPDELLVSGGGAHNRALLAALAERFPGSRVRALPNAGEEKEALLFAFLAREHLLGRPANLPSVTGASHPVILGALTPAPPRARLRRGR